VAGADKVPVVISDAIADIRGGGVVCGPVGLNHRVRLPVLVVHLHGVAGVDGLIHVRASRDGPRTVLVAVGAPDFDVGVMRGAHTRPVCRHRAIAEGVRIGIVDGTTIGGGIDAIST